jgi:hypothetical protein
MSDLVQVFGVGSDLSWHVYYVTRLHESLNEGASRDHASLQKLQHGSKFQPQLETEPGQTDLKLTH